MSSLVGRDDLKAKLYSAGVKDPRELGKVMSLIDIYSLQVVRRAQAQDLEDAPEAVTLPSFTPLKPGEWSVALQVTCCIGCTKVRRWENFDADKSRTTGHKVICKDCRRRLTEKKLQEKAHDIRRGGWVCPGCGERKIPREFPLEKRENSRKPVKCLSCLS
jgi:hypothetical protein